MITSFLTFCVQVVVLDCYSLRSYTLSQFNCRLCKQGKEVIESEALLMQQPFFSV